MISVVLMAGRSMKVINKNAATLMKKEGMNVRDAYEYAYKFSRANTDRLFSAMHTRSQKEQRLR
tara:strand:+ start:28 stop:219 length:192 start_codon:yes stop_codon:yes gene_type:complete